MDIVPHLIELESFKSRHPDLTTEDEVRHSLIQDLDYDSLSLSVTDQTPECYSSVAEGVQSLRSRNVVVIAVTESLDVDWCKKCCPIEFDDFVKTVPQKGRQDDEEYFFVAGTISECASVQKGRKNFKVLLVSNKVAVPEDADKYTKIISCESFSDVEEYILTPYSPSDRDLTYTVLGYTRNLPKLYLHRILRGWTPVHSPGRVTYLHQEVTNITPAWQSKIRDRLCDEDLELTDKRKFLRIMSRVHNDHHTFLPATRPLEEVTEVLPGQVLIVKPSDAARGEGITVVSTTAELEEARRLALKNSEAKSGVVSTYIRNPALIYGYKFHLRVYLMVTCLKWDTPLPRSAFQVFPKCFILSAADKYVDGDYTNTKIHDTHFCSSHKELAMVFPDDFPDEEGRKKIQVGIDAMTDRIVTCFENKRWAKPPSTQLAYQILGPDILFDEHYNPWLLEVNLRPSYCPYRLPSVQKFFKEFFEWEYKYGVQPLVHSLTSV